MEVTLKSLNAQIMALTKQMNDQFTEMMSFMRDHLVTREEMYEAFSIFGSKLNGEIKSELRAEISADTKIIVNQAKQEIFDYVDKKDAQYRGELVSTIRKEDEKVDETIDVLATNEALTQTQAENLQSLGPFAR